MEDYIIQTQEEAETYLIGILDESDHYTRSRKYLYNLCTIQNITTHKNTYEYKTLMTSLMFWKAIGSLIDKQIIHPYYNTDDMYYELGGNRLIHHS